MSGKIVKLFVDIGYKVRAGEPLAKIDDRDYVNSVERAKAEVERLKIRSDLAKLNFQASSRSNREANLNRNASIAKNASEPFAEKSMVISLIFTFSSSSFDII